MNASTKGTVIPDSVRQILTARGYGSSEALERFLNPSYDSHIYDPFLLTDMEQAVERIVQASEQGERVVIYGDYDIDGITASAVMIEGLRALGIEATSYIPDRFEEGYGLNLEAFEKLKAEGIDLVITVDCGVTGVTEVAWANENGLDVVITDHHAVPEVIPAAIAVINPKRPNDIYPFKDLAGVGVAFKLIQALQLRTSKPSKGQEKWLLDLVALGTVCDVVTLLDENRVLAKYGLRVLQRSRRVGLAALAQVSGVSLDKVSSYHLGYIFGPRMNAAGRLEHAAESLELLLTAEAGRAAEIAERLDDLNSQRRAEQARILEAATKQAEEYADDPVLVLAGEDWNHGVVGIVASKIVEMSRKPTIILQVMGSTAKGSARSTANFNMVEGMRSAADCLSKFGGHFFAAGCTLDSARIAEFRQAMAKAYLEQTHGKPEHDPAKAAEGTLSMLAEASWELLEALDLLEPYGNGNPKPLFASDELKVVKVQSIGTEKTHLKLVLADTSGKTLEAIGFGIAREHPNIMPGQLVRVKYQIAKNEFNGRVSIQLIISELK